MKIDVRKIPKGIFRADRLRDVMDAHGATVDDIVETTKEITANKIYHDAEAYRAIATGKIRFPDILELVCICEAVNVSADYLLGLSEKVN